MRNAQAAYGDLGLHPWQFWRLTIAEFDLMVRGRRRASRFWWYLMASLASILLTPWSKRPPTAERILGWRGAWWEE